MTIGDTHKFAIESSITSAYARRSFRALGFFLIHVGGYCYGIRKSDASMLACSFDEIEDRIARRGKHIAPFAATPEPNKIAEAFSDAVFVPSQEDKNFFGISHGEFLNLIYTNHIILAPDGDQAFDDGSFVLHFDIGDRVRLIAFKRGLSGQYDFCNLSCVWLAADDFYQILKQWRDAFESEWAAKPKVQDGNQ